MTAKIKLIDGNFECFDTDKFFLEKKKNMRPDVLEVSLYSNSGRRILHFKRRFHRIYKKYFYKPLPQNTKEL